MTALPWTPVASSWSGRTGQGDQVGRLSSHVWRQHALSFDLIEIITIGALRSQALEPRSVHTGSNHASSRSARTSGKLYKGDSDVQFFLWQVPFPELPPRAIRHRSHIRSGFTHSTSGRGRGRGRPGPPPAGNTACQWTALLQQAIQALHTMYDF